MDLLPAKPQNTICYCCLRSNEEIAVKSCDLHKSVLNTAFQMNHIYLCYLCKRIAQHAELFITNVQNNQELLEKYRSTLDSTVITGAQNKRHFNLKSESIYVTELNGDNAFDMEDTSLVTNIKEEYDLIENIDDDDDGDLTDSYNAEMTDRDSGFPEFCLSDIRSEAPIQNDLNEKDKEMIKTEAVEEINYEDNTAEDEIELRGEVELDSQLDAEASDTLPEFLPDSNEADAQAWLKTVEICLAKEERHGTKLNLKLSKALKGTAATWFSIIAFKNMKWVEFKNIFLARFKKLETGGGMLLNFLLGKPRDGENLASYVNRLFSTLMAQWNNLSKEEIVVTTILSHVGQIEPRVQGKIFNEEINTYHKMHDTLKSFSYRKRGFEVTQTKSTFVSDVKKVRSGASLKCYNCGKLGHMSYECVRPKNVKPKPQVAPTSTQVRPPSPVNRPIMAAKKRVVICYKCRCQGHVASHCWNLSTGRRTY